jgi:hypothetical protein
MQENDPVQTGELVRVPGLYRRWELPEILKNHRAYRIENAGAHGDGTPLVAIYADGCGDGLKAQGTAPDEAAGPVAPHAGTVSRPGE